MRVEDMSNASATKRHGAANNQTRPAEGASPPCPACPIAGREQSQGDTTRGKSIATLPRLEFDVTHSFKRRKHFLTGTRMGVSAHANQPAHRSLRKFTNHKSPVANHATRLLYFKPLPS